MKYEREAESANDWRLNNLVLETIFSNMNMEDLKSASCVCKTWLAAAAKAFGATCRVVVRDPRPEYAPKLANVLDRFHRVQRFRFELKSALPYGLKSTLFAEFPLGATIKHLSLQFEPTKELLTSVNGILLQLTSRFPVLEQLDVWSTAGFTDEFQAYDLPPFRFDGEHAKLAVLKIGPNVGAGLDWRFLRQFKNLRELHLIQLHISPGLIEGQLGGFVDNFPKEAQAVHLAIGIKMGHFFPEMLSELDQSILKNAFKAIQPKTCVLFVQGMGGSTWILSFDPLCLTDVIYNLVPGSLSRLEIWCTMPLSVEKFTKASVDLARYLQDCLKRAHDLPVLLRFDIPFENETPGFVEVECSRFEAPLVIRIGPTGSRTSDFEACAKTFINEWITHDETFPIPRFKAMRKYTFGQKKSFVRQQQFFPAEQSPEEEYKILEDEDIQLQYMFNEPGNWNWRETKFVDSPSRYVKVSTETSWSLRRKSEEATMLIVYSID